MTDYTPEQRERAARQIWPRAGEDWLRMVSAEGSSFEYRVLPQCVINAQAEELKEVRELLRSTQPYVFSVDHKTAKFIYARIDAWLQRNEVKA